MTSAPVARFMASLFPPATQTTCVLLDAGAGIGALSCAFLDRWIAGDGFDFGNVEVQAYELDSTLRGHLTNTLEGYTKRLPVNVDVSPEDFITAAALQSMAPRRFTHAILNPPYKKINSDSMHRLALRQVGIETVNLYSAFVALSLSLMKTGGQIVAIIPRSFCNGPYYRPFRDYILNNAAIHQMHLFASRNKAFRDDDVLQENVIIRLEKHGKQGPVTVSHSTDDSFTDLVAHEYPFDRIVFPSDSERFIHVPTTPEQYHLELSKGIASSLSGVGVGVSTGPVVDFRLRIHIQDEPGEDTVPLLYAGHFTSYETQWPKPGIKRGNAISLNDETRKWLYPNGWYTVVRRFSSKEEARRIIAGVVHPDAFPGAELLGFENHLNVFHEGKRGMPQALAYGVAVYLNTTAVDEYFRRFNGHTQVNATDLRLLKYPSRDTLISLGEWAMSQPVLTQPIIDKRTKKLTT